MKKLNNKGMSLVELIVSFAIVTVAVVYFFQSLITVSNIYKNVEKETNELVKETYYLRLLDNYYKNAYNVAKVDVAKKYFSFNPSQASIISSSIDAWATLNPENDSYLSSINFFYSVSNTYNPKQKLFRSIACLESSCTNQYVYYAYFNHNDYDVDFTYNVIKLK